MLAISLVIMPLYIMELNYTEIILCVCKNQWRQDACERKNLDESRI